MEDLNDDMRLCHFHQRYFLLLLFIHTTNSENTFMSMFFSSNPVFFASGGVEQLVQGRLWRDSLLQQHLSLRLPLLSRVRACLPLKKDFIPHLLFTEQTSTFYEHIQ